MTNPAEQSPIIVCGCQRSGTTAIVRILNENGTMVSNEWALFAWPAWKQQFSLSQWLENKRAEVELDPWLQHWHLKINLAGDEAEKGFPAALHSVYGNRPQWNWGDKWSDYVYHAEAIKTHFPRAKIIYIYRDGRDVVASMIRKKIAMNTEQGFRIWVNSLNAWRTWEKKLDHLAIRQEDLLQRPGHVATAIAQYCNFPLKSAAHAAHVLLGADENSNEDYVPKDRFRHTGAYHDQFSDDAIPVEAKRHLDELGYGTVGRANVDA